MTSIGLDHTEYLGDDARGDRAREGRHLQAGRAGGDRRDATRAFASCSPTRARARRERRACASSPTRCGSSDVDVDATGTTCDARRGTASARRCARRSPARIRRRTSRSRSSMLDAAGAPFAAALGRRAAARCDAFAFPGGFSASGKFIFDVAHNPAGAEVLAQTLARGRAAASRSPCCSASCATRTGAR